MAGALIRNDMAQFNRTCYTIALRPASLTQWTRDCWRANNAHYNICYLQNNM